MDINTIKYLIIPIILTVWLNWILLYNLFKDEKNSRNNRTRL